MRGSDDRNLILIYIYLATGCVFIGIALVLATLLVCQFLEIDITKHFWILILPVIGSLILNVLFIEIVQRIRRK